MDSEKERSVLIVDQRFVMGPEFTRQLCDRGFIVSYRNCLEEARELIRQVQPVLIIAEASSAGKLLDNDILANRQDGIFLMDQQMKLLGYFERTFLTEELAIFLSDYLKALS